MKCPFDGATLQVVNRSGIEIDWCPDCRGVWLERGELDRLIRNDGDHRDDWDDWDDDDRPRRDGSRRRRGGLLSEIFDF